MVKITHLLKKFLLILPAFLSAGCAGPCYSPGPVGQAASAVLFFPLRALNPRTYHGPDGYSSWNAIPYLGVQTLTAIDRFERSYIVEKYKLPSNFTLERERWGMDDKVTFFQVNGRKRLLYFDTFPNEIAARGITPAKPG